MIGNNVLSLNEATVIAAVQEYLDKRMTPSPVVVSVKFVSSTGFARGEAFEVQVREREALDAVAAGVVAT